MKKAKYFRAIFALASASRAKEDRIMKFIKCGETRSEREKNRKDKPLG